MLLFPSEVSYQPLTLVSRHPVSHVFFDIFAYVRRDGPARFLDRHNFGTSETKARQAHPHFRPQCKQFRIDAFVNPPIHFREVEPRLDVEYVTQHAQQVKMNRAVFAAFANYDALDIHQFHPMSKQRVKPLACRWHVENLQENHLFAAAWTGIDCPGHRLLFVVFIAEHITNCKSLESYPIDAVFFAHCRAVHPQRVSCFRC